MSFKKYTEGEGLGRKFWKFLKMYEGMGVLDGLNEKDARAEVAVNRMGKGSKQPAVVYVIRFEF